MNLLCIVVTGVGGGVGQSVIKGLRLANKLKDQKYRIVGLDSNPLSAGLYRADRGYQIPPVCEEKRYLDALIRILNQENASVLIPGSDPEVVFLAKHCDTIETNTCSKVIVSPLAAVMIGYDKWNTYRFLTEKGFIAPITVLPDELDELMSQTDFPLIVKPRVGSGSKGVSIVLNREELDMAVKHTKNSIIQEYLVPTNWSKGNLTREQLHRQIDEYSTEVLTGKDGQVFGSITNWREMVNGVPMRAIIEPFKEIRTLCEQVVEQMNSRGPVNLQARITDKGISIFEINTRFSGSTAVRCAAGFNGPALMIRHFIFNEPISDQDLEFENLVEMRFKQEMYVKRSDYEKMLSDSCTDSLVGIIYDYF